MYRICHNTYFDAFFGHTTNYKLQLYRNLWITIKVNHNLDVDGSVRKTGSEWTLFQKYIIENVKKKCHLNFNAWDQRILNTYSL